MENNYDKNNDVHLSGKIISEFSFSHSAHGEAFYTFMLECQRLSSAYDILPVTVSERLLINNEAKTGDRAEIKGQLRSYNSYSEGKTHLILTVFAKEIEIENAADTDINTIYLNGYICKPTIYRKTPFGREIADILLAVNRLYNKSDYIPVICWGRNAKFAKSFEVGDNVLITGRIQSRNYQKKISEEEVIEKTAYEVSVSKIEIFNDFIDEIQ